MKILHVIPSLELGGAESVVVDLSNSLSADGHSVAVLTASGIISTRYSKVLDGYVNVNKCWTQRKSGMAMLASLVRWVYVHRQELMRNDIIHCHLHFGMVFGVYLRLILLFSKNNRTKLVVTNHMVGAKVFWLTKILNGATYPFFSSYVCVADSRTWRNINKVCKLRNFKVILNGIASSTGQTVYTEDSHEPFLVGTLSRLSKDRKPERFIDVFREIEKQKGERKISYVIGGYGPLSDKIVNYANSCGLAGRISFLGQIVQPQSFLNSIDIFVSLNVGTMTGIAGLEAIRAKVPVVGIQTQKSFIPDPNDWIWSSYISSQVAAHVLQIYNNKSLRKETMDSQNAFLQTHLSIEKMKNDYIHEYRRISMLNSAN
jgi:glycosyltransferase involved in cell wall biosynthesis